MQVLNLIRGFDLQKIKEADTIKEYSDRLLSIVNKVRLLGTKIDDSRIVEKVLVTVPERYEASITTLKNTKDLSKITLVELLNALNSQEQRRLMRQDPTVERALSVKHQDAQRNNKNKNHMSQISSSESRSNNHTQSKGRSSKGNYPPCKQCGKWDILHSNVGRDLMQSVANAISFDMKLKKKKNHCNYNHLRDKIIFDVLYVLDIDQNLLSVGQLIEKEFKVSFENWYCRIQDATGQEILRVKMRDKSHLTQQRRSTQLFPPNSALPKSGTKGLGIVIFNEC
ncbi:uncharacterized protein LOC111387261 [Olea europaea var. sylvestris]|uniref:uncharacterized protein LOC111387261 n=1 Tax=Olea europaea var. sylvestris TaxID=158386 RepID=UPI000C1CE1E6|nr:uncharacterized protein LOC111387261 [Olea europaea var. sylvestris]